MSLASGCAMVCVALIVSAMAIVFDAGHVSSASRQIAATGYATTSGRVLRSRVYSRRTESIIPLDLYRPEIEYSYEVNGRSFHGSRYRFGDMSFVDGSADSIVATYPAGAEVAVFYDPNDPAESLLRPGLMGVDLFDAMGLFVANVMALAVWRYLLQHCPPEESPPIAGGARIVDDAGQVRVCLSTFSPPAAALAAAGATLGAALLAVFLTVGSNPPLSIMVVAWILICGAGIWGYRAQAKRLAAGEYDLVIDKSKSTVRIPRTMGRKEEMKLAVASIIRLDVEAIAKRAGKGMAYRYTPVILFTSDDGRQQKESLVELSSAARARALAGWIGERLQTLGWNPRESA
jgi:hypothetical protein